MANVTRVVTEEENYSVSSLLSAVCALQRKRTIESLPACRLGGGGEKGGFSAWLLGGVQSGYHICHQVTLHESECRKERRSFWWLS